MSKPNARSCELEATLVSPNHWCVRPKGQLGTCGWVPEPWTAIYVNAPDPQAAVKHAVFIRTLRYLAGWC